jgi:hypothetical protein
VQEALEVFTGVPAGELDENGDYPENSLLGIARTRAHVFWERSLTSPQAHSRTIGGGAEND